MIQGSCNFNTAGHWNHVHTNDLCFDQNGEDDDFGVITIPKMMPK